MRPLMMMHGERKGRNWMEVDPDREITLESVCATIGLLSLMLVFVFLVALIQGQ